MRAVARADFKYEVTVDGEMTFLFREICPRDFYWFSLVENDYPDIAAPLFMVLVMALLLDIEEDDERLTSVPKRMIGPIFWWISKELMNEKLMKLDQWFKLSFHLCKQRWDSSVDWFEDQPMSKILLMTKVMTDYADEQNREMKKASRRK